MTIAEITTTTQNCQIIYEMPLSDAARICLRLEGLFQQFDKTIRDTSSIGTKNAMHAILKLLEVTDRPDIKSKLSQLLMQYRNAAQLKTTPTKIDAMIKYLHSHQSKIGEILRQNDFLSQIRSNLTNPGGVCDYRLPAYMLWQNKPHTEKQQNLAEWMSVFESLREISETILTLTRSSASLQNLTAENGFYLQQLNPAITCHLVRVAIPAQLNLFPEFGAGKHRLTIRFLEPNYIGSGKSKQAQKPFPFQLACCGI